MTNPNATLLPPRFAVDYTGVNPDNRVHNEPHQLSNAGLAKRAVAPLYGPFYHNTNAELDTFVLIDAANQQILSKEQYHLFNLVPVLTNKAPPGYEVYETAVITDRSVSANVLVSYQSVGGYMTQSMQAIKELLDILYSDSRPVYWPNILETPEFTPEFHRHPVGDGVGYEQLVVVLERLRQVIILADSAGDDVILKFIDDRLAFYAGLIETNTNAQSALGKHLANATTNPHGLTAADVGLGKVKNYPVATQEEAIAGNLPNRYMTPALVRLFVEKLLEWHFNNQSNPHGLTARSINLEHIQNYEAALTAEDISGANANAPKYATNIAVKLFMDTYLSAWEAGMRQQLTQLQSQTSQAQATASAALTSVNQDISQATNQASEASAKADASQLIASWCNDNVAASESLARSLLAVYIDSQQILNWVALALPQVADWRDITFGNDRFVAIAQGTGDKAAYSLNGITWQNTTLPTSTNWQSIAYGNGVFVAIATSSNVCATSSDGITWATHSLPSVANWYDVTFGNGKFVAVGYGTQSAVSPDGTSWAAANMPSNADWVSVAYGAGLFVAVARGSDKSATSPDGAVWQAKTLPKNSEWTAICFGNNRFMVSAAGSLDFASSTDGLTWAKQTLPAGLDFNWQSICYGDGKYLAAANGASKAVMSVDGLKWTERILPSAQQWIACAYGKDTFVIIAKDTSIATRSKPLDPV